MSTSIADAPRAEPRAPWFAFLGAPAAWSVQELASYSLTAHACYPMDRPLAMPSSGAAWTATFIITVAALVVALLAFGSAVRIWGDLRRAARTTGEEAVHDAERGAVARYLAFIGIPFGALFSAIIVFGLVALLVLPACG